MRYFDHIDAQTVSEAVELMRQGEGKTRVIAGGTDILSTLKRELLPEYPQQLVNIKTIEGLDYIKADKNGLRIGATARLTAISENTELKAAYPALAEAARSVATPLVRNLATIGGNLCQEVRCWYYRYPNTIGGRVECARKGGKVCDAMTGENRYHSIFGGVKVHTSACTLGCPAGTDIPAYLEELRAGNLDAAADILMEVNPFPAITARVCSHFCQQQCARNEYDEAVNIGALERFVGDYILDHPEQFYEPPGESSGKRIAIIGSGPAGLTAAFFLRRGGHQVTIYDKMAEAGGLLRYAIPNYRLPKEIVSRTIRAYERMGVEFVLNTEIGKDIPLKQLIDEFDSVFLTTGAWKRPLIGLEGEELTTFGLDFLIEVNEWLKDKIAKDVIVVGGGNVAVDVAITAKRMGAANVTMACLEPQDAMPASPEELARAEEEGIKIMPSWGAAKVIRAGDQIKGLQLKRCIQVFDGSGRFAPQYDENETREILGSSILMAVGQTTDLSFLDEKLQLEVNRGLIAVNEKTKETSIPKVFAVGDVITGPKTVVAALADGKKAAGFVEKFLTGREISTERVNKEALKFDPACVQHSQALRLAERPKGERTLHAEDNFSATRPEIAAEASRCFNCGCVAVNPSDIATVLVALDATIKTSKRQVLAAELFCGDRSKYVDDELVLEVSVPPTQAKVFYDKFRVRESHDFAIVSVATAYETQDDVIKSAKIVLGALAPNPLRAYAAEDYLTGKAISPETAKEAARLALADAIPLEHNAYKIQIAKGMVERSILEAKQ